WNGMLGNATAFHAHIAPVGQNGVKIFDVMNVPAAKSGTAGPQTFAITAAQVAELVKGNVYATVHSTAFPQAGGAFGTELRGQFALAGGVFTDQGGNVIGVTGPGSGNTGFTGPGTKKGTVATPLNPGLNPLGNSGGPMIGVPGAQM